jgi:hypothetical protein
MIPISDSENLENNEIYDIPFGPEGSLSKGHSFQG